MYVYTGHDEDNADFFWMQEWRVYSTDDMVNWTDHGSPLALESFSWADDLPCEITRIKEYKTNKHVFMRLKME